MKYFITHTHRYASMIPQSASKHLSCDESIFHWLSSNTPLTDCSIKSHHHIQIEWYTLQVEEHVNHTLTPGNGRKLCLKYPSSHWASACKHCETLLGSSSDTTTRGHERQAPSPILLCGPVHPVLVAQFVWQSWQMPFSSRYLKFGHSDTQYGPSRAFRQSSHISAPYVQSEKYIQTNKNYYIKNYHHKLMNTCIRHTLITITKFSTAYRYSNILTLARPYFFYLFDLT